MALVIRPILAREILAGILTAGPLVHGDVGQRHRVGPKVVLLGHVDRSC